MLDLFGASTGPSRRANLRSYMCRLCWAGRGGAQAAGNQYLAVMEASSGGPGQDYALQVAGGRGSGGTLLLLLLLLRCCGVWARCRA